MTTREPTIIDNVIGPALREAARADSYFTKREVLAAVLRRRGLAGSIKDVRRGFPGQGFDTVILRYIEDSISQGLKARDANGIRLYECYSDLNGTRRWRRFRSMGVADIEKVLADVRLLAEQLNAKVAFLEAVGTELRTSGAATVDDVYEVVVALRRPILL